MTIVVGYTPTPSGRAALLAAAEAALEPYLHDGELHSEAATHIVVAVR